MHHNMHNDANINEKCYIYHDDSNSEIDVKYTTKEQIDTALTQTFTILHNVL